MSDAANIAGEVEEPSDALTLYPSVSEIPRKLLPEREEGDPLRLCDSCARMLVQRFKTNDARPSVGEKCVSCGWVSAGDRADALIAGSDALTHAILEGASHDDITDALTEMQQFALDHTKGENMDTNRAVMEIVTGGFAGRTYPMTETLPHPDAVELGTVVRSRIDGRCWETRHVRQRLWLSGGWRPSRSYKLAEWVSVECREHGARGRAARTPKLARSLAGPVRLLIRSWRRSRTVAKRGRRSTPQVKSSITERRPS